MNIYLITDTEILYKMKTIVITVIYTLLSFSGISQDTLDALLDQYNNESIPYISVKELTTTQNNAILLDAREKEEYEVSHLKSAIHVGYDNFNLDLISKQNIPKDTLIVVYCSLGIRSEDISEKLKKVGYKNIYNLYGGIFEWKNNEYPVVNSLEEATDEVHVFSSEWGKWLLKGKKVYSN